jgi:hypothetical protein
MRRGYAAIVMSRAAGLLCASCAACGLGAWFAAEASHASGEAPVQHAAYDAGATLSLTQRVLHAGQFAGMKPGTPPTVTKGAATWVATEGLSTAARKAELARLHRLGFVAGIDENLVTPSNQHRFGLSLVEQFSSAASARAELTNATHTYGPWTYYSIPGIPGARGFDSVSTSGGGRNVGFIDGPYFYVVGAGWNAGASNAVSRDTVIAGALLIYRHVHGG